MSKYKHQKKIEDLQTPQIELMWAKANFLDAQKTGRKIKKHIMDIGADFYYDKLELSVTERSIKYFGKINGKPARLEVTLEMNKNITSIVTVKSAILHYN